MFTKPPIKYSNLIQSSDEYKQLDKYYWEKCYEEDQSLFDWQKRIISRWLLNKLVEAKTWNNPDLISILLTAHTINETLERRKEGETLCQSDMQSHAYLTAMKAKLEKKLNDAVAEISQISDLPITLEVTQTGIFTISSLSKRIVNLYTKTQKMQQLEGVIEKEMKVVEKTVKLSV